MSDLPEAVHGSGAAFLDGSLYLAGGKSMECYQSGLWVSAYFLEFGVSSVISVEGDHDD